LPAFSMLEDEGLPSSVLLRGAAITAILFVAIVAGMGRAALPTLVIGSQHPRPTMLGLDRDSMTAADATTAVSVAEPAVDPLLSVAKDYFSIILVLRAIDHDGDLILSPSEIASAPARLAALDKDGDGCLSPAECGQSFGSAAATISVEQLTKSVMAFDRNGDGKIDAAELPERMRGMLLRADANHDGVLTADEVGAYAQSLPVRTDTSLDPAFVRNAGLAFMNGTPVLAALDTDHDGRISTAEMLAAPTTLRTLDINHDGSLEIRELLPDALTNQVNRIFSLDTDFDGKISQLEQQTPRGLHYRELLRRADRNGDGVVTRQELSAELQRIIIANGDGFVSWEKALRLKLD